MSNNAEDDIAIAQGAVLVKSCEVHFLFHLIIMLLSFFYASLLV